MKGPLITSSLGVLFGLVILLAQPARGYPIDCAILLCLAGGFPASNECSAAHAEMTRRITPWPIEPPLQLWRCPTAGASGMLSDNEEATSMIDHYRDGIEVWQLSKQTTNSSGGRESQSHLKRSFYDAGGTFQGVRVEPLEVPPWVDEEVRRRTGTALHSDFGSFNAILMRHYDHQGEPSYEWISY